ncbi:DUF4030 domain-containing protein [Falsibacillus pallidus]|uniref:DUF4030 domain-containing protein n=1 Tax=Falsibacillus pallidus TaxID=493781 RepID=UPI003D95F6C7
MDRELSEVKKHFEEQYFDEEIAGRIKEKVNLKLNSEKKRDRRVMKRITFISSAAVLMIGLFIGSAFVSPAVEQVAAKIPYLKLIFKSQMSISERIYGELKDAGYKIEGAGVSFVPKKTVSVTVGGSEKYYSSVKGEIKKKTKKILDSWQYDAYKIQVEKAPAETNVDERNPSRTEQAMDAIVKKLEAEKLSFRTLGTNEKEKEVEIELPDTDSAEQREKIKGAAAEALKENGLTDIHIKIHLAKMKFVEMEQRWQPVISAIAEGLMSKSEYKVRGVGYSFHPLPLTITIKTSVDSKSPEAKRLAEKIENEVNELIHSDEAKRAVKDDPYRLIIYSKDKKELNKP